MEMIFYEADAPVTGVSFQSHSVEEKDERTTAVPGEKDSPNLVQVFSSLYKFVYEVNLLKMWH